MVAGHMLPSVNDATKNVATKDIINQIGSVLPRIIEVVALAPIEGVDSMFSKLNVANGFWCRVCAKGQEWNFAYVLPAHPDGQVDIMVPFTLQMGWAESPGVSCAVLETVRDVAATYVARPTGLWPARPLKDWTMPEELQLPSTSKMMGLQAAQFLQMLEVYVDDYLQFVQSKDFTVLWHCSRAVVHIIHSVFPPSAVSEHIGADPVSLKNLKVGEGLWETSKERLGWMMDGTT